MRLRRRTAGALLLAAALGSGAPGPAGAAGTGAAGASAPVSAAGGGTGRAAAVAAAVPAAAVPAAAARAADTPAPVAATTAPAGDAPPVSPAPEVLPATAVVGATVSAPDPVSLASVLQPLVDDPSLGPRVSAAVVDAGTGTVLYDPAPGVAPAPASTVKVLTALAALRALGPQARLATKAVRGADGEVVLVGGGDSTLVTRRAAGDPPAASLSDLARRTAAALGAGARVRLRVDDTAFTGPALAPDWSASFPAAGVVAPVAALSVDAGRVAPGASARSADPPLAAGRAFAAALRASGVEVDSVSRGAAPAGAAVLAAVASPTVADLVERTLEESDNDMAEALLRLAGARLGGSGSFTGGATAVRATLVDLGLDVADLRLADGSGLSRTDAVPAALLAGALAAVARQDPAFGWPVATGLPVAGLTGTLADRFDTTSTRGGAGVVRAKTGTLTGVSALAGTVRDADGRLLTFAVSADQIASIPGARTTLDKIAARIAGCGCRG